MFFSLTHFLLFILFSHSAVLICSVLSLASISTYPISQTSKYYWTRTRSVVFKLIPPSAAKGSWQWFGADLFVFWRSAIEERNWWTSSRIHWCWDWGTHICRRVWEGQIHKSNSGNEIWIREIYMNFSLLNSRKNWNERCEYFSSSDNISGNFLCGGKQQRDRNIKQWNLDIYKNIQNSERNKLNWILKTLLDVTLKRYKLLHGQEGGKSK